MNKFLKIGLFGFLILVFAASFAPFSVKAQNAAAMQELMTKMEENRKKVMSIDADLNIENFDAAIGTTDAKSGRIKFMRSGNTSGFVRIDYAKPVVEILSATPEKFEIYSPDRKTLWYGNPSSKRNETGNALELLSMSTAQLRQKFQSQFVGADKTRSGAAAYKARLTPKTAAQYKFVDVWIADNGMPVQFEVTMNGGDRMTVTLSQIQLNPKLSKDVFSIKAPKDVQKVKA